MASTLMTEPFPQLCSTFWHCNRILWSTVYVWEPCHWIPGRTAKKNPPNLKSVCCFSWITFDPVLTTCSLTTYGPQLTGLTPLKWPHSRDRFTGKALQLKLGIGKIKKKWRVVERNWRGTGNKGPVPWENCPEQGKDMVSLMRSGLCLSSLSRVTPAERWEHFHLPYLRGFQIRFRKAFHYPN